MPLHFVAVVSVTTVAVGLGGLIERPTGLLADAVRWLLAGAWHCPPCPVWCWSGCRWRWRAGRRCTGAPKPGDPEGATMSSINDDELRKITVGDLVPLDAPVHLAEYDPGWPGLFTREAARIRAVLGDRVLLVEHVGSTSVPGLAAKPIIDMVLAVADSSDEPSYVPDLEAAGYVLRIREPDWYEHRVFKGPAVNINLHVFTDACVEIDRMITFRDRLRADDADRETYERTKRELAGRTWRHIQHYANAKSAVVTEILGRAAEAQRDA